MQLQYQKLQTTSEPKSRKVSKIVSRNLSLGPYGKRSVKPDHVASVSSPVRHIATDHDQAIIQRTTRTSGGRKGGPKSPSRTGRAQKRTRQLDFESSENEHSAEEDSTN